MIVPTTTEPASAPEAAGWDYRRGFDLPSFGYREFGFPTLFADSLAVTAVFPCSLQAARRELGRDDLEPLAIAPGLGCAVVSAYCHRSVSEMEAYNETVLLVAARAHGALLPPLLPLWLSSAPRGFGHAPLAMPVDSVLNVERGTVIWGLPKYAANPSVRTTARGHEVQVLEGERSALSFTVPRGGRTRFFDLRTRLFCAAGPTTTTQRGTAQVRQVIRGPRPVVCNFRLDRASRFGGVAHRLGVTGAAIESRVTEHLTMRLDLPVQRTTSVLEGRYAARRRSGATGLFRWVRGSGFMSAMRTIRIRLL